MTTPVIVAPFANERIREWPIENFRRFIEIGLADGRSFAISGTRAQRPLANLLVRGFPADRVHNLCGSISWQDLQTAIREAPFVVANNSGIAHLAAEMGQWTLCVFAGSHQWIEWMPRGPRVVTLARMPVCAPCCSGLCPNRHDCMVNLTADFAYDKMMRALADDEARNAMDAAATAHAMST